MTPPDSNETPNSSNSHEAARAESHIDEPRSPEAVAQSFVNRVVAASLAQPLLVGVLAIGLIAVGAWSFSRLPVDAYPDVSPPMVEIISQWPGHAAEEVERLITVPVEAGMNGTPNLHVMRSISLYGLSDVRMTFDDQTDTYFARQQVSERIPDLSLPAGVSSSIAPMSSPSGLVYRYVVQSPDRTAMQLKIIQDWVLQKQYKSVPGVADMSSLGGQTMEYQVLVDPTKLAGAGLNISTLASALDANNGNAGGGFYSEGGQFYYVRGLGRLTTLEDIGNTVVAVQNGTPVLVKDVGSVEIGYAPRLGQFGFNDQ
ncbi:MAG TPA: efflux RND transporter permease subunit, partial [Gemmatimonadaceae bacterium]